MKYSEYNHNGIQYLGYSEGGVRTSIIVPFWNSMFDMGNTNPDQVQYDHLFITHPHLDHFSGLPYYISQRSLRKLKPPKIIVPKFHYSNIQKLINLYAELEQFPYQYELIPLDCNERFELSQNYFVTPFPTFHRIPSQGYTVFLKKTKLKKEYHGLPNHELVKLKELGHPITEVIEEPQFSFSGDTKIEYVLEHEAVQNSKVLFLECTYIDEKRNVSRAREWGHIHLDEIIQNADAFKNERLVLIHFSPRYSHQQIRSIVEERLPPSLQGRVYLFLPNKK